MSHYNRTVFDRVMAPTTLPGYALNLSAPQNTSLGHLVGDIYYKRSDLLKLGVEHLSGFPHNGGEHTMRLHGSRADLIAWLDIVIDIYRNINFQRFQEGADTLEEIRRILEVRPDR